MVHLLVHSSIGWFGWEEYIPLPTPHGSAPDSLACSSVYIMVHCIFIDLFICSLIDWLVHIASFVHSFVSSPYLVFVGLFVVHSLVYLLICSVVRVGSLVYSSVRLFIHLLVHLI